MPVSKRAVPGNRLIAALPIGSRRALQANCDEVQLDFAEVLCEVGERVRHVYFPVDSFISLVTTLDDGDRLEVGMVGDEGMLGTSIALGVNVSPQHATVQGSGGALRMSAAAFARHCADDADLRRCLSRYVHVLLSQLAQTAACTHFHVVESRLARWLLLSRDRAHSNEFRLTHQFLAYMLGVRRVGITQAASALQERGLIEYVRGQIFIRDGRGLEKASCHCYREGNEMYERTMGRAAAGAVRQRAK